MIYSPAYYCILIIIYDPDLHLCDQLCASSLMIVNNKIELNQFNLCRLLLCNELCLWIAAYLNGNWKQCCRKKKLRGNPTFLCVIESSHKENCYNSVFGLLKLVSVDWISSRLTASIWMTFFFINQPKGLNE